MTGEAREASANIIPVKVADDLTMGDLGRVLAAGLRDFFAAPLYGLFFAAIYVGFGLLLYYTLFSLGQVAWVMPVAAGFPLFAPFAAVGMYEVSRRREAGLPLSWGAVLGALRGRGDEQIVLLGGIIFVIFSFWLIVAHGIFAIFHAQTSIDPTTLAFYLSSPGLTMLAIGSVVGGVMALGFYALIVISLPMLIDQEVDFITAIIASLATVRANKAVMLAWAAIVAVILAISLVPAFLGLLISLPVLGHASWHLYRRAITPAAA